MSTVYRRMQGIFPRRRGENSKVVCAIFLFPLNKFGQGQRPPPGMLRGGGETSGGAVPPPLKIPRKGHYPPHSPLCMPLTV